MQEVPPSLHCEICLTCFKHKRVLAQHKCSISLCAPEDKPDLELRPFQEEQRLLGTFLDNWKSMNSLLRVSYMTGTAMPGLAPLFFTSRQSPPILEHLGCVKDCYNLLRAAAEEGPVKLWKSLKIKNDNQVLNITKHLVPNSSYELKRRKLKMVVKQDHVMIYHIPQVSINYLNFIMRNTFLVRP